MAKVPKNESLPTERLLLFGHILGVAGVICISVSRLLRKHGCLPETALVTPETFNVLLEEIDQAVRFSDLKQSSG